MYGLLQGQYSDEMIANTQMIAFGLDCRINNLVVKELRRLWLASNPPVS